MRRSHITQSKILKKKRKLKYNKILLKISGELLGRPGMHFDQKSISYITDQIVSSHIAGAKVGVVIGGGNIIRGRETNWLSKIDADTCGMTATVINGIVLQSVLSARGFDCRLSSGLKIDGIAERFNRKKDLEFFNRGGILIFVAGTGNPLFTTDTAAALRSVELEVDILIKATKVDGVYSADPIQNRRAILYRNLSFHEAIAKNLGIMDLAAFNICRENKLPVYVYNLMKFSLVSVLAGSQVGTLVQMEVRK